MIEIQAETLTRATHAGVTFFHAYPHRYGGAQRFTHTVAKELPGLGYQTQVITPADGPFVRRLQADGVEVRVVPAAQVWTRYGHALEGPLALPALGMLPRYWVKLARVLLRLRPTLVHCNDHRGLLLAGPAARLA